MATSRRSILSKTAAATTLAGVVLAGLVVTGVGANAGTTSDGRPTGGHSNAEANTKIVRAYLRDVFNKHNPEKIRGYVTPSVKWHGGSLGTVQGVDGLTGLLGGVIGALPDLEAVEQSVTAQGDLVAVRLVVTGTQRGELLGIPATGKTLQWDAVDIYRINQDGKISEEWAADDITAILLQTGAITAPWLK
jgi:predicted ester cyclase